MKIKSVVGKNEYKKPKKNKLDDIWASDEITHPILKKLKLHKIKKAKKDKKDKKDRKVK